MLDAVLKYFLPMGLSIEQRESERQGIHRFVRELNQIRKNHIDRDFANSFVVSNVSALVESYPFVSITRKALLTSQLPAPSVHFHHEPRFSASILRSV